MASLLTSHWGSLGGADQRARILANTTVADALLAIARLGGHIKDNGPPGWIVLGRGYQKLLALKEGILLTQTGEPSEA
jgi:hypothetical protein